MSVRNRGREPWYDSDDPGRVVRGGLSRGVIYTLVILAVCAVVGIGVWGFRVATSDVKGRGDATVIKNEARNRIRAQEGFEARYADIVASDRKIDIADRAASADPADRTLRQNAAGVRSYCLTVMTRAEVDKLMAEAQRKDDEEAARRASGHEVGMPTGTLLSALTIAGRDKTATICPVFALRLRSSGGRQIVDGLKERMQSWDDAS